MHPQITPLTSRSTGPETRRLLGLAFRKAVAGLDRRTLVAFNPVRPRR